MQCSRCYAGVGEEWSVECSMGRSWEGFRSRDLAGRTIGDQRGSPVDGEVVSGGNW